MPRHIRAKPGNAAGGEAQRNVRKDATRFFPCPLCKAPRDVRTDKNGKLYIVCPPCCVQMFVRCAAGMERLTAQSVPASAPEIRAPRTAQRAERIVTELADLRERRAKLSGLFASNDAKQAAAVFAREIKALEAELAKLAKPKRAKRKKPRKRSARAKLTKARG